MNIGTLTITLGADMTQLHASLSKTNSALQRFGFVATTALTAPMVAAGKASFQMAKDYEYVIQTIVGLTGTAQSTVDGLNQSILKMAPELARSPLELAKSTYFIMSSGIKDASKAMEVLTVSAKAATSGLGETQAVANVLTSALNAYAGTGISAASAADVLVSAVREGKAEATGFATAIGQIIPIGAQLGVSFDQVAGGMAAITLTGASASNAAVYLKGVFNSLLTASKQGETALKAMGTSYAGLRKILAEQGLIALMQKLRDMQKQYGDEMISEVLPNIRALTGFLSLAGKNFQYNTEIMNKVTNSTGSLNDAFAAVADTIKVRYDSAISKAQVSLISLGTQVATTFLPILERLVQMLENLANWFDSLSEAQRRNVIVIAMIVAALGPLSLVLSSLIWIVRGLIPLFASFTTTMLASTGAIGAFVIAFTAATSPIIKQIMEMRKEINLMQEALDFSDRGMELDTIIGKKMKVLSDMNLDELSQLKSEIAERSALDRQRLLMAKATNAEEIAQEAKHQQEYLDLQTAYNKKLTADRWWEARSFKGDSFIFSNAIRNKHGSELSLELQKLQNQMNSFVQDKIKWYDYEKTAFQGNIDFYTTLEEKVNAQIKAQEKLKNVVKEIISLYSKFPQAISQFPQFNIDMGLPDKFQKSSGWEKAMKTDWSSSSNLYKGKWQEEANAIKQYNERLDATRNIIDRLDKTFVELFSNIGGGFKGMIDSMINAFKLLLAQLAAKAALFGLLQLFMPGSNLAVHALTGLRKFIGMPGYANGTNYATGGLSIVGERGPELMNIPRGAQIMPNLKGIGFPSYEERLITEISGDNIAIILQRKARRSHSYR